jgi:signal transduction histidine kinase
MKPSVTVAGWLVVSAQALLLVLIAVLLKRTTDDTLAAATNLAVPHEVSTHLEQIKGALGVVEDALDVYMDDPSPARREQYEVAVVSTFARMADLRGLPEGGLSRSDLASIEQTVDQTLAEFARLEALREKDGPELMQGLLTADTKQPLYAGYRRIDEVIDHEKELTRELEASLNAEAALLDWSLLAAGLAALLLQGSVVALVQRDQRRRIAMQSALRSQNELLEATVAERTTSLTQAKEELAWVSQRALHLQERERHNLALELHDQIGQQLAALRMILQHVEAELDEASYPELRAHVRDGLEVTRTTYAQIHDIAINLRPAMLDRLGLVPTLEWYARQQAARGRCRIDVRADSLPAALPTDLLTATFRIAQEAVSNALRHAKPKNVEIQVGRIDDQLELIVRDDGVGFDPHATLAGEPSARSFGLLGMRERATAVGGTLAITSRPGTGTKITATLPLPLASASQAVETPALPAAVRPGLLPSSSPLA